MAKIKAPNREYNGSVGDVVFKDGAAETDNLAVIQYCRSAGYEVDGETTAPPEVPEAADPRNVGDGLIGTPLRDGAVDPKPEDFLGPVNAGQGNPHGPEVVSPEIHASPGPTPIVPGLVPDDPDAQQERETGAAKRVLVDQEPVGDVVQGMAAQDTPEPPAGNASADEWRAYAVEQQGADPERVAGMKRDDLRAEFGPKAE